MPSSRQPASTAAPAAQPSETELKFALPESDSRALVEQLRRSKPLARRRSEEQMLESVYFDTADELLKTHGIALRVRSVEIGGRTQWLQTLKTAGSSQGGLSTRGEWEAPVGGPAPEHGALQGTPFDSLDIEGTLFSRLEPRFTTRFTRRRWLVQGASGSSVEVALDIGEALAGSARAPIRELELELKSGEPEALFKIAGELAATVALLPAGISKAQRGQALAAGSEAWARRAAPPELGRKLPLPTLAHLVLAEAFGQFADNLVALLSSDHPEVVHQARVGWRRLRSALKLLKPVLQALPPPDLQALAPLRAELGRLRDTDVAATATLPAWTVAFAAGDAGRLANWNGLENALREVGAEGREQARALLRDPAVGRTLLAMSQWLHRLGSEEALQMPLPEGAGDARQWLRHRIERLHGKLRAALHEREEEKTEASEHEARITAKSTRYGIEAVAPLLPAKAKRWAREATQVQERIGEARDLALAAGRLQALPQGAEAAEFLRGVAAGQQRAARKARKAG